MIPPKHGDDKKRERVQENLRLVERRLEILRPGTMPQGQSTYMRQDNYGFLPRPNKRIREEIAEIDGELLTRANRFDGGYQRLYDRREVQ